MNTSENELMTEDELRLRSRRMPKKIMGHTQNDENKTTTRRKRKPKKKNKHASCLYER